MNKSFIVKDFVVDNAINILATTETWLRADMVDASVQLAIIFIICLVLNVEVVV